MTFPFVFDGKYVYLHFYNHELSMSGIYAHIPFCKSRCIYCGFYSTTLLSLQDDYVDAMLRELDNRRDYLPDEPVTTIYIGGGTPSMLSAHNLSRLCRQLKEYAGSSLQEFTVECNPDDITPQLASLLYSLGVNRVSMGAQTFSDERLAFIHRRHKAHQVKEAVENLRNAGITNISIDLMFGFHDETVENWKCDIEQALSLGVQHISAYSLMYEEGTPLYRLLENGKIKEINEELSLEMYDTLINLLSDAGYEHYEISNFALPGLYSRHNSSYWDGTPYLGLGAAAHSYDGEVRRCNIADLRGYMHHIIDQDVAYSEERLSPSEQYDETVMLALRTARGLDTSIIHHRFGQDIYDYLMLQARPHIAAGLLTAQAGWLRLTPEAVMVSDNIIIDLFR